MKTRLLLPFFLACMFNSIHVFSCSCLTIPTTFCSIATAEHTYLTGEIVRHYERINSNDFPSYTFMDILVKEKIHGEVIENMITVLGEDGTSCGINLERYEIGTDWLFKLRTKTNNLNVNLEFPLFRMSPCNINTLPIQGDLILGLVAPSVERMTIEKFKENLNQCFLIVDSTEKIGGITFKVRPTLVNAGVEVVRGITHLEILNQSSILRILNANGQLMKEQYISEEETLFWVDMSVFPKGVYFLAFQTGSHVVTKKVVKV